MKWCGGARLEQVQVNEKKVHVNETAQPLESTTELHL